MRARRGMLYLADLTAAGTEPGKYDLVIQTTF